jgi:hypothetical protein
MSAESGVERAQISSAADDLTGPCVRKPIQFVDRWHSRFPTHAICPQTLHRSSYFLFEPSIKVAKRGWGTWATGIHAAERSPMGADKVRVHIIKESDSCRCLARSRGDADVRLSLFQGGNRKWITSVFAWL